MAMSYTSLIGDKTTDGSIAQWVNYSNSKMPVAAFVEDAENAIYQTLRVREMKTLKIGTMAIDDTTIALPADYLTAITLRLAGDYSGTIDILDSEHFENTFGQNTDLTLFEGTPSKGQIIGNDIHLDTKADLAYPYRFVYFELPDDLSVSNETNFLTTRYSHILRNMCISKANEFLKDTANADRYLQLAELYIEKANVEYDMERAAENFQHHWD